MLSMLSQRPFSRDRRGAVAIVVGNTSKLPRSGCREFGSRPPGFWFPAPEAARKVQHAVLQACRLRTRTAPQQPRSVVFMPRVGAKLQSKGWRNFEDAHQLQAALEGAVPEEARPVHVVGTPGDAMGVCAQVALWQSADVLLTPNGAHFVNAPFLAPGSVLIEGVPWSMRGYIGQTHATRWATGVHHLRLHSARPPASAELGPFAHVANEEACAASELCRRRYRDRAMLHVDRAALLAVLRPTLDLLAAGCADTPHWRNPFGRTCADYATPVPPSKRGKPEAHGFGLTGGWCEAGHLKAGARWAGGGVHGWPERHCCACGKANSNRSADHGADTNATAQ